MMSRCFTWFPNWLFQENPIYTTIRGVLQELGILLGGVSDCEELVGVTQRISLGKSRDLS